MTGFVNNMIELAAVKITDCKKNKQYAQRKRVYLIRGGINKKNLQSTD